MKIKLLLISLALTAFSLSANAQKVLLKEKTILNLSKANSYAHSLTTFNNTQIVLGWHADTLHYWATKGQFFNLKGEAQDKKFKFIESDNKRNIDVVFSTNDSLIIAAGAGEWAGNGGNASYFMYSYNVKTDACDTLFDFILNKKKSPLLKDLRVYDNYAYMASAIPEENNTVFKQDIGNSASPLDTLKQFGFYTDNMASNSHVCMHKDGLIAIAYEHTGWNQYNLTTYNFNGDSLKTYNFFNKEEESNRQDVSTIKTDADGNYYLCWTDGYSQSNVFGDTLKIQKYSSAGESIGKEVIVNKNTSISVHEIGMICDNSGHIAVAWVDKEQWEEGNIKIYLQLLDKDLNRHGNEILIAEGLSSGYTYYPKSVILGDTLVVVWNEPEGYKMSTVLWEKEIEVPEKPSGLATPESSNLLVYPNPFSNKLDVRIILNKNQDINIYLSDINGKVVCQVFNGYLMLGSHSISWESEERLTPGVYFYTIQTKDSVLSGKLLKY